MAGILLLALALSVAACGRKPDGLLPPEGSEGENYPRTYPAS
jgi:predicted small lipoprotein YifL